jgi:hypothetical protein
MHVQIGYINNTNMASRKQMLAVFSERVSSGCFTSVDVTTGSLRSTTGSLRRKKFDPPTGRSNFDRRDARAPLVAIRLIV